MIERYVDAAELRRLVRSLMVILAALGVAGLFAVIVIPGLRNANKPASPPALEPVGGEWGWLDPNAFPPMRGYAIPPLDPQTVLTASPKLLAEGRALFIKDCVQCHGAEGQGDGPASAAQQPRPRNFTRPEGWQNGSSLPAIYKTLSNGIAGSSMASVSYLQPKERMALAHYVQSLGQFAHAEDPPALAALAKELARPGGRVPNRIPVAMAIEKLVGEARAEQALAPPPAADQTPGARLLREALVDGQRAGATLAGSSRWRASAAALAELVCAEAPANGFAVRSATFSSAEWETLRAELLRRIGG